MKKHMMSIGKSVEWITPRYILDPLGNFDLDPCTPKEMPWDTARKRHTIKENGLAERWFGRVWLNPPFDRRFVGGWMRRMAEHNNGIMLVPAAMETRNWKENVWGCCCGVLILDTRPHFCHPDGSASRANCGQTIALVAYGDYNWEKLLHSGLGVALQEVSPVSLFT